MDTICIFKRVEKKYLLTEAQYNRLLNRIGQHLRPDEHGRSTVMSLYLDTPDRRIIRSSIEAVDYKEKLRLRCYGTATPDSTVFLELKKKFGGVVYKRRAAMRLTEAYLMRAEAKYRKGDVSGALTDLNTIRKVRGVKEISAADFTLDKIYNERGYEFYFEGENRRQDMIRFGHFFEARTTKPNVTESYKYVFPIPQEAMEGNPNIIQNDGY